MKLFRATHTNECYILIDVTHNTRKSVIIIIVLFIRANNEQQLTGGSRKASTRRENTRTLRLVKSSLIIFATRRQLSQKNSAAAVWANILGWKRIRGICNEIARAMRIGRDIREICRNWFEWLIPDETRFASFALGCAAREDFLIGIESREERRKWCRRVMMRSLLLGNWILSRDAGYMSIISGSK